jgi:hypothetical protein
VTVENRGGAPVGVHLEDGQLDVRTGADGESALLDWRNSQFIEGYDIYPLRRATAVLYAAAADASLHRVDIQVHVRMDEEWTERHLWSADLTLPAGMAEPAAAARAEAGAADLAGQVSNYLRREAERGQG